MCALRRQFCFNACVRMESEDGNSYQKKLSFDERVKPKNVLALNEKVAAIRRYEVDPVYKSVGRYFNCSPDQIKRIIKQKEFILAEWNNRTKKSAAPTIHEVKSVKMSVLGKAVHEWIRRMMYYTDFNLSDALIQTMAIEFKKVLGLETFLPDKTWVANFRSTYDLANVNTKTLTIGYYESHSVQVRDILRHLQEVCNSNGVSEITNSIKVPEIVKVENVRVKDEPYNDVQMTDVNDASMPSCSSAAVSRVKVEEPTITTVFITQPAPIAVLPVKLEPVDVKPEPLQSAHESVQMDEHLQTIKTHDDAINCVKMLEEFALLKENFRLIGLIERLEEALKTSKT